jgi:hypothetical protein
MWVMAPVFSETPLLYERSFLLTNIGRHADYDAPNRNYPKVLNASSAILPFYITAILEFDRIAESPFKSAVLCTGAGG